MSDSNVTIPASSHEEKGGGDCEGANISESDSSEIVVKCDGDKPATPDVAGSKIIKPSGLKQPGIVTATGSTRIGRPCNNIPKPAIPRQNASGFGGGGTMASASSLRKMSDELTRRRISDLSLTDDNSLSYNGSSRWSYDRKSSSGSVLSDSSRKSSSDDIRRKKSSDGSLSVDSSGDNWKFDNEPRRTSDISVVLTQDTDSFIIGDRVWVGGTKPGQIAYIGETQFAPGEWAGVVLDEPIGKNDGSVANIRYFQCEPKRGIFSRLTRLTKYPLLDGPEVAHPKTLPLETARSTDSLTAKALPRKPSPVLTPTSAMSRSMLSKPSSPDSSIHPNISIGDRVIVMSSQGSKAGVLRFLGATDFAPGEWCGVELDDPLGKNDGSVAGTRYFECRPKFGLFAPLHKVSKSPASRRPSQASCQIHRGGGSVGIRRQSSKESLASMSSVASTSASVRSAAGRKIGVRTPTTPTSTKNALQEILKEKELHIEQLLKERDLERSEVTRAASQADEAEKKLIAVRQEFERSKDELEARIADMDAMVSLLKAENEELSGELEEEKKKNEDLQFRFEEISIESGDLKGTIKNLEDKIINLEKTLADERKRVEVLEVESNKLFEAEEQLVLAKEENDTLRASLTQKERTSGTLEQENITLEATVTALRAEIETLKTEVESLKNAATQDENQSKEALVKTGILLEETKQELAKKNEELLGLQKELENKSGELISKEKELNEKNATVIKEMQEKHKAELSEISGSFEELKISSGSKLKMLEEKLNDKMQACSELETRLQDSTLKLSQISSEKSAQDIRMKEAEERFQKELVEQKEIANNLSLELRGEKEKCEAFEKQISGMNEMIKNNQEKMDMVSKVGNDQMLELNNIIEAQKNELDRTKSDIIVLENERGKLKESLEALTQQHAESLKCIDTIRKEKDSQAEKLASELKELRKEYDAKIDTLNRDHSSEKQENAKKVSELEVQRIEESKKTESLEKEVLETKSLLGLMEAELESEKKSKETLLEKIRSVEDSYKLLTLEKENLLLEAGDSQRKLQSVEEKYTLTLQQKEKLENDIAAFINSSNDSSVQMSKLNNELRAKEKDIDVLREELSKRTAAHERFEQEHKQKLASMESEFTSKEKSFMDKENEMVKQLENLTANLQSAISKSEAAESDMKIKLDDCVREKELKIKTCEDEINALRQLERETNERHEYALKDLNSVIEKQKEELSTMQKRCIQLDEEWKKKEEVLQSENDKFKQELEKIRADGVKSQREMMDKAKEDSIKATNEKDALLNELKTKNEKLDELSKKVEELKSEKAKDQESNVQLKTVVENLEALSKQSEVKRAEMETHLSALENENKVLKDSINQMRDEKYTIDKNVTDKEMIITDLKAKLDTAEEWRKRIECENETRKMETENLKEKLDAVTKSGEEQASEKDKCISGLKDEITALTEEIKKMQTVVESETKTANSLKNEVDSKNAEAMTKAEELKKMSHALKEAREALAMEKRKTEEGQKMLTELEKDRSLLTKRVEEQEVLLNRNNDLSMLMEDLKKKILISEEANEKLKKELEDANSRSRNVEFMENLVKDKENNISDLANQVEALTKEKINLVNNNRIAIESLEKQKADLQRQLDTMQTTDHKQNSIHGKDGDNQQTADSQEFTQGQVDFLNSVIVDMQKKNDALKARIEILEMGFTPEDVEEFALEGLNRTAVAPRLFCDICEMFDLHDTEDCPTQNMEQYDEPPPRTTKTKTLPQERPYCETCEVFGHDTADCDDAETF